MSDPIEELENFNPGDPVTPLPAADVRRRGDRLRRRNTALVGIGAAAAVALIATPLALINTGDARTVEPAPQPSISNTQDPEPPGQAEDGGGLTEIPADFPLADGFPDQAGNSDFTLDAPSVDNQSLLLDLSACGESPSRPFDEIDRLTTRLSGPADFRTRELLLYQTPEQAQAVSEELRGFYEACPEFSEFGSTETTEVVDGEIGNGSWVAARTFGLSGQDVIQAVPVGNALLVVDASNEGTRPRAQARETAAELPGVLEAMQVFASGEAASDPREQREPTFEGSGEVPSDFPLDEGINPDGDGEYFPPAPDVEGITFPEGFCGEQVWPAGGLTGRLAVKATGPESALWRELVSFKTADDAVTVIAGLRESVRQCPEVGNASADEAVVFNGYDIESGYDAATFSYTYPEGLGGVVYQFVRVGRGVLGTATYGEWSPRTARLGADDLNEDNRALTSQLCVFADAGC